MTTTSTVLWCVGLALCVVVNVAFGLTLGHWWSWGAACLAAVALIHRLWVHYVINQSWRS